MHGLVELGHAMGSRAESLLSLHFLFVSLGLSRDLSLARQFWKFSPLA